MMTVPYSYRTPGLVELMWDPHDGAGPGSCLGWSRLVLPGSPGVGSLLVHSRQRLASSSSSPLRPGQPLASQARGEGPRRPGLELAGVGLRYEYSTVPSLCCDQLRPLLLRPLCCCGSALLSVCCPRATNCPLRSVVIICH